MCYPRPNLYNFWLIGLVRVLDSPPDSLLNLKHKTLVKNFRSSQGFTLVEIMIVVVIIGLLAAMAIPAFQKVRAASQDKAVTNNLRQLSAAADQYFLEFGNTTVSRVDLIGTGSSNYIKIIATVANEAYPGAFTQGIVLTATGVGRARTVTYNN